MPATGCPSGTDPPPGWTPADNVIQDEDRSTFSVRVFLRPPVDLNVDPR